MMRMRRLMIGCVWCSGVWMVGLWLGVIPVIRGATGWSGVPYVGVPGVSEPAVALTANDPSKAVRLVLAYSAGSAVEVRYAESCASERSLTIVPARKRTRLNSGPGLIS